MKEKLKEALASIPLKQKVLGSLASIPLIAAATMSGSCAGGCPYGLVNDPFPGQCRHYIDSGGDGICDLSQVAASSTTSTSSSSDQTSSSTADSGSTSTSSSDSVDSSQADLGNSNGVDNASLVYDTGSSGSDGASLGVDDYNYHVLPISFLLISGYLFTHFLFKKGILKPKTHKRLWNLLVTVGYAGVGVTGILLTLMVNLGIKAYSQGITFWHAETAVLMVIGTLIHLHIYRKPFTRMFKVLFRWDSWSLKKPTNIPQKSK
ncbi:MAG: hypothetical protein LUQ70_06630 [Methanobacteriaceae archaeon]|nr:hypothetical protein [Methanobacteriaceae archaeon]